MCTLTFIPISEKEYILTQNRDEFPGRAKPGLVRVNEFNKELLYPEDKNSGGTWIAVSNTGQVVCLLNGAFEKHKHRPPYKRSRGIVVLDLFREDNANRFFDEYDFDRIEPFTMVVLENMSLFEFRWDGSDKHIESKDPLKKHIWASCTLYSSDRQKEREQWFKDWHKGRNTIEATDILDFHRNAGVGDPFYNLVMNRMDIVKTTSITSVQKINQKIIMEHIDLLVNDTQREEMDVVNDLNLSNS